MKISPTIKFVLLAASSLTAMAGAIMSPTLPSIKEAFIDNPLIDVLSRLVLTLPALFIGFIGPLAGWIVDKLGRKKLLVFSLLLYGIGGTSGFYLDDIYLILLGRAILGISVAGILTTTTTLIGDYFEGNQRNAFLGLQASVMALGGAVYVTLGGFLTDISWRYPFLIYSAAWILIPISQWVLFEPQAEEDEMTKHNGQERPENGMRYFIYFMAFMGMVIFYMVPVQIPFLMRELPGINNTLVGLAISGCTISAGLASLNYSRIKGKLSYMHIYAGAFLMNSIGYTIIAFSPGYWGMVTGLVIAGIGSGLIFPNSSLCMIAIAPLSMRGRWVGGLTTAFFFGQFISPIMVEPLRRFMSLHMTFVWVGGALVLLSIGLVVKEYVNPFKPHTVSSASS